MTRQWTALTAILTVLAVSISDAQAQRPSRGESGSRGEGGDRGSRGEDGDRGSRSEGGDRGSRSEGGDRGSRGEGGGGPFGGGGRRPDPEQMWGFIGKGKDSLDLNAPENARTREMMERMGSPIPSDGILRKADFVANFEKRMAERDNGGGPPSSSPGSSSSPSSSSGGNMDEKTKRTFDFYMDRYDKNKDGKISSDEASSRMKPDFAKYDKNRDGFIDKDELRVYVEQFTSGGSSSSSSSSSDKKKDDKTKEIVRPTVIRYGKLPKGVPDYFVDLDKDKDGQIGLYEWRRGNKETSEFIQMDLNKDAYLTAEEWVRYSIALAEEK